MADGILVTAPNGATVNFPAGTDHATIDSVMRQHWGGGEDNAEPAAPAQAGGPLRLTVRPQGADAPASTSPEAHPAEREHHGALMDALLTIPSGLARGVADVAGLPDFGREMVGKAVEGLGNALGHPAPKIDPSKPTGPNLFPSSKDVRGAIESATGPLYEPETRVGKVVNRAAEFVPGALAGPGGVVRNAVTFGAIPGAASEIAGQAFEGSAAEPWARAGAGLAAGVGGAMWNRPSNVGGMVRRATDGVTDQHLDAAEELFQAARQRGVPITRAEALQHVTDGGTDLGRLQRVVESGGEMRPFFAQRPGQVERAGREAFDDIAPVNHQPSGIGPAAGRAAEEEINGVRGQINNAAEPHYTAASRQRLDRATMAQVRAAPGWNEARDAVRNDPQLARYVTGLPDDSVGFLNEVQKHLRTAADNAASPVTTQGRNMQRSAGYGQDATLVRDAARRASPEFDTALAIEAGGRERFLDPLLQGPLGKMAGRDTGTREAIEALFPKNPIANSEHEIERAVSALSRRYPPIARDLVRAHAEAVFNQATKRLQGGPNEFGGAGFAAAIRGNPQAARNLEASVRALPNGEQIWPGFNEFLNILEAQGHRQRAGSATASNLETAADLRRGGAAEGVAKGVLTGGFKIPQQVKDTIERWRMGSNVRQFADLLTNPEAALRFRDLIRAPRGSQAATVNFSRLVYIASADARKQASAGSGK